MASREELRYELENLYVRRQWIDNKIADLEIELQNTPKSTNGSRRARHDKDRVLVADIRPYVEEFCQKYDASELAKLSTVDHHTITKIRNGEQITTGFGVADRLLTAMDRMDVVGELKIVQTAPKPPVSKFYEE